jgi:hypothetical protein
MEQTTGAIADGVIAFPVVPGPLPMAGVHLRQAQHSAFGYSSWQLT